MESDNPLLDRYFLSKTEKNIPKICFIPTASGDSEAFLDKFYTAFKNYNCQPSHLAFFRKPTPTAIPLSKIEQEIMKQDAIYVGGGNTRSMLAVWREWQLDRILKNAWESGILIAGMSAGAICWFEYGVSDFFCEMGRLDPITGLNLVSGSCTPHFDGESNRRSEFHRLVDDRQIPSGIGIDDGAAVFFAGDEIAEVVASKPNAKAYRVKAELGKIVEEELDVRYLGNNLSV